MALYIFLVLVVRKTKCFKRIKSRSNDRGKKAKVPKHTDAQTNSILQRLNHCLGLARVGHDTRYDDESFSFCFQCSNSQTNCLIESTAWYRIGFAVGRECMGQSIERLI